MPKAILQKIQPCAGEHHRTYKVVFDGQEFILSHLVDEGLLEIGREYHYEIHKNNNATWVTNLALTNTQLPSSKPRSEVVTFVLTNYTQADTLEWFTVGYSLPGQKPCRFPVTKDQMQLMERGRTYQVTFYPGPKPHCANWKLISDRD